MVPCSFRRGVPARLRPIIGATEIIRSLNTRRPEQAKRWGVAVAAEVDQLFAEAEVALKNPSVAAYKLVERWPQSDAACPIPDTDEARLTFT